MPDCRAYEQASPVNKNAEDAAGFPNAVQASASGEGVSFFTLSPFAEETAGSAALTTTYLASRPPSGEVWLDRGLLPRYDPVPETSGDRMMGLSEDLARTIVVAEEPPLVPGEERLGAGYLRAYVEDNATGTFQLLAANVGPETVFFADATPDDSHILFESTTKLTANAEPNVVNLYEWDESKPVGERVSLAGVLPNGKGPVGGSVAGPGGPLLSSRPGGSKDRYYTQNTVSEDGSRVFFSDAGTGFIWMRAPQIDRTVQVSAGKEAAEWRAATPDGAYVFYTEGTELYRFNVDRFEESEEPEAKALEEAREPITTGAEGVFGMLGISSDGAYAYFVSLGKLASNVNGHGEEAEPGQNNLYAWHQGAQPLFIAKLAGGDEESGDAADWLDRDLTERGFLGPSGGERSARVTPDGRRVLFSSVSPLTGYDNLPPGGECEGGTFHPCYELYVYDTERPLALDNPVCVSCNPSAAPATANAFLDQKVGTLSASPAIRNSFMTRNLSSDGSRVFFQTRESLVSQDTNEQWDVYEWEREDTGSCTPGGAGFSARLDGCLYLISTGQSDQPSYFGDSDATGENVFFFTRQSLVNLDQDDNADVYDARVDGGLPGQNQPPTVATCAGETCRGASEALPTFGALASAGLTGSGNLAPIESKPAVKPKPKPKKTKKKAKKKAKKRGKKARKSVRTRRSGGRFGRS